jgi:hypothetical protein
MPAAKKKRVSDSPAGFAFINVTHPGEIRRKETQRKIRSNAMAAIGRSRRKGPRPPITIELSFAPENAEDSHAAGHKNPTENCISLMAYHQGEKNRLRVPPSLPHLGVFAVEPDSRARELFSFGM